MFNRGIPIADPSRRDLASHEPRFALSQFLHEIAAQLTINFWRVSVITTRALQISRHNVVAGSVAEAWFVNTELHIARKMEYKGGKQKHNLRLAFDALTLPATYFLATCQPVCCCV